MATQWITVANFAGAAGHAAWAMLTAWHNAREPCDESEWSHEQWPQSTHEEVHDFVARASQHAAEPPMVYFARWLDSWSVGDLFLEYFSATDAHCGKCVLTAKYELYGISLPPDDAWVRNVIRRMRFESDEEQRFNWHVRQAILATPQASGAALFVVREVLGGLVTEEELRSALLDVPDWLAD